MKTKGIDLLCASPASTAICVDNNMDESSSIVAVGVGVGHGGGGRAIDRHNPHVRDGRRRSRINTTTTTTTTTTTSNPLIAPSYSSSQSQPPKKPSKPHDRHNKSSKTRTSSANNKQNQNQNLIFNPSSSSRYLLSDTTFLDVLTEFEPLSSSSSVPIQQSASSWSIKSDEYPAFPPTTSSSSTSSSSSSAAVSTTTTTAATACNDHQVVVLRVSLHCKGCEGKVRKHISKMKGVTSFCIDFGMKKVTVVGDVTPLGVLASISRVKNAHFWPSMSSSSSLKSTHPHV